MDIRSKVALGAAGIAAGLMARRKYLESREMPIGGSVVLITGGSRGLGLALAHRFAREGCRIAICARDQEELERAEAELTAQGATVMIARCDVTKRSEVDETISAVRRRYGQIDILVNNAGIIKVGPVQAMTPEDFKDAMDVIFWGTVNPTLALLPSFLEKNHGQIVNITSIGAKVGVPHLLPYTSAKYAAAGFSEGLRSELKTTGVKVTTIAPGLMRTGSWNEALFKGDAEAEATWFSIGSSLPGLTISAERAACEIVSAVKRGDAERVLSLPAAVLARAKGIAPGFTEDLLGFVAQYLLPRASNARETVPGRRIASLRSWKIQGLMTLGRLAARRLNQRTA